MATFNYDSGTAATLDVASEERIENSAVKLKRAFVTLGQLKQSPWYLSVGQLHMPFGRYSSLMLSAADTRRIGRITGRGVVVGYDGSAASGDGWVSQAFIMQGKSNILTQKRHLDQVGASAAWMHHFKAQQYLQMGGGWVRNIADADSVFNGLYDFWDDSNTLKHRVPGLDAYMVVGNGPWRLGMEYVGTLRRLEYNTENFGHYHSIQASLDYAMDAHHIPSNLYAVYGHTHADNNDQAGLAYWATGAYMHLWKNTMQALEYRFNDLKSGGHEHQLLMQIGAYF